MRYVIPRFPRDHIGGMGEASEAINMIEFARPETSRGFIYFFSYGVLGGFLLAFVSTTKPLAQWKIFQEKYITVLARLIDSSLFSFRPELPEASPTRPASLPSVRKLSLRTLCARRLN